MLLAVRAARPGRQRRVVGLIALAVVVQLRYLAVQVLLFRHDLRQFTPQGSAYGSIYFTLLGRPPRPRAARDPARARPCSGSSCAAGLTNYWLIGVRSGGAVLVRGQRPGGARRPHPAEPVAVSDTALQPPALVRRPRRRVRLGGQFVANLAFTFAQCNRSRSAGCCRCTPGRSASRVRRSSSGWPRWGRVAAALPPRRRRSTTCRCASGAARASLRRSGAIHFLAIVGLTGQHAGAGDHRHDRDRRTAAAGVPAVMSRAGAIVARSWPLGLARSERGRRSPSRSRGSCARPPSRRRRACSWAPSCSPATARAATASPGRGSARRGPAPAASSAPGRRCAVSGRWRRTSTCAPATCRCRASTTSPSPTACCSPTRRSARWSTTSPRLGRARRSRHPNPAAGTLSTGQQLFTLHCAGCHQIDARGGFVTGAGCRRCRASAPRGSPRRCGSAPT